MTLGIQADPNIVSTKNSTITVPTILSPYIGTSENVLQFAAMTITVGTDQVLPHTGTLLFEFSSNGTNWDVAVPAVYTSAAPFIPRSLRMVSSFFRLRYTPDDNNLTGFRLTTILHRIATEDVTRVLSQTFKESDPGKLTAAALLGIDETNTSVFLKPSVKTVGGKNALNVSNLDPPGTLANGAETVVSSSAIQVLAANAARKQAIIQNTGSNSVRVGAAGVTATSGLLLVAGSTLILTPPNMPTNAIFAIRVTLDSTVFAQEIT